MILCITGPTGVGKTDAAWSLLASTPLVMLDCDAFASRTPFSWQSAADVASVFEAIGAMMDFHIVRGAQGFVVTLTQEMASGFRNHRGHLVKAGLPLYSAQLTCDPDVLVTRIAQRDRTDDQKARERIDAVAQRAVFATLVDDFPAIDTTWLDERAVAARLLRAAATCGVRPADPAPTDDTLPRPPTIRTATPADAAPLAALGLQVWLHTYATAGVSAVIADYVLATFDVRAMSALVVDPDATVFVAEADAHLVGYAVVRFDAGRGAAVELATLYVQEHFARRGVGARLLSAAEDAARWRGHAGLWLTVNARNANAIGFYDAQGYARVGTAFFGLGGEQHENHVLERTDAPVREARR